MTVGCVHLLYYSKIPSASSWAAHVRVTGTVLKRQAASPSITCKITPAGSLSSSQPGGPTCWASSLALSLIGFSCESSLEVNYCIVRAYLEFTEESPQPARSKITEDLLYLVASQPFYSCSTTGKPTRSFATERVSLDSV
jgi:hypothetical protein